MRILFIAFQTFRDEHLLLVIGSLLLLDLVILLPWQLVDPVTCVPWITEQTPEVSRSH